MQEPQQKGLLNKLDYPVPAYSNSIVYMFGGISMAAFAILISSGIFLTQFYSPTLEGSHASIAYGIQYIPFVDFVRSLHFWTANLVVGLLLLHVIRVFITGSYKKPRILTWLTGVGLLGVTLVYIFVGSVLKWDQEGVEAFGHMKESFELFGLRLGLTNAGIPVITQLYSWHTTILLLALLALLCMHIILIKVRGISAKPTKNAISGVTAGRGKSSFLLHIKRVSGFGLIFLSVAGLFAIAFPAALGHPGILEQEVTKPLWVFWPFFGLEDIFGLKGLVFGMAGFFSFLLMIPFIDQSPYIHWTKRKPIMVFSIIFLATVIGLGIFARFRPQEIHLGMDSGESSQQEELATSESLNLSHQILHKEAVYLVPFLLSLGGIGMWFAFKKNLQLR